MPDEPDEFAGVDVLRKYAILAERRVAAERRAGVRRVIYFVGFGSPSPPRVESLPGVGGRRINESIAVPDSSFGDRRQDAALYAARVAAMQRLAARDTSGQERRRAPSWGLPGEFW
jgi:hypothetical protein